MSKKSNVKQMMKTFDLKNHLLPYINLSIFWLIFFITLIFLPEKCLCQKPNSSLGNGISRNLNYYIDLGLKNSPNLQENQNLMERNRLDSTKILATQKPLVSLTSTAQFFPSIKGYGYNQAISNGGNYLATLGFSQPVFNKYLVHSQIHANQVKIDSLRNSGKISLLEIKKNITNQYILAYADFKQIGFQKDILSLYREQEILFKKLVQQGIFKQSDYLTFLVSRQAQEINLTQIQISYHNNLAQLNLICGLADTISYDLEKPQMEAAEIKPYSSTYQFHKFELDSLSLLSQRNIIASNYKPKISWIADAGYVAPDFNQFYKNFGTSIGISLSLNLYDGHQKRISNKQIDLDEKTRLNYLNFYKKEYDQELLSLRKQVQDLDLLEYQLKGQLKNNELLVDIDRKLLNVGDLKINDLILAINNYKTLQYSISQIEVNRLTLINQINFWSIQN